MAGIEEDDLPSPSPSTSASVRRNSSKRSSSSTRHHHSREGSTTSSSSSHRHHHHSHRHSHHHHSLRKQVSVASMRSSSWKLKYQDFSLQALKDQRSFRGHAKNSDTFQKLMTKANEWLRDNPTVQVQTCEVITWMSFDPVKLGDCELMTVSKRLCDGARTFYARGLRLWLAPQQSPKIQTLCYEDFVPETGDRIPDLVAKINIRIERRQLKGRILSVQTVGAPVDPNGEDGRGRVANDVTGWADSADHDGRGYAFFLRVFSVTDANTQQDSSIRSQPSIGIKDFAPEKTGEGYEAFEALIDRTNTWLKNQTNVVSITNMQSVIIRKEEGGGGGGGTATGGTDWCGYVMPGVNSTEATEFLRILRVVFVRRKTPSSSIAGGASSGCLPSLLPIAYETFTPQLMSSVAEGNGSSSAGRSMERLETMRETFSKVVAYLRNSGAEVICTETVINPMHLYSEDNVHTQSQRSEETLQFLFTIRLYLSVQWRNGLSRSSIRRVTSTTQLMTTASGHQSEEDEAAAGAVDHRREVAKGQRSSPLFLGSVVTRQFKYRWLVLAVSAFTCMTVIVVLSVVYSNK